MSQMPTPSFTLIIQLHHLQAMLQLGLIPNPATGQPNPVNMAKAKHELALLQILQEKTEGNLTPEEENMLSEVIQVTASAIDGAE